MAQVYNNEDQKSDPNTHVIISQVSQNACNSSSKRFYDLF